jgi:hypothetical protein
VESACLASVRPWVQTLAPQKKKKKKKKKRRKLFSNRKQGKLLHYSLVFKKVYLMLI